MVSAFVLGLKIFKGYIERNVMERRRYWALVGDKIIQLTFITFPSQLL